VDTGTKSLTVTGDRRFDPWLICDNDSVTAESAVADRLSGDCSFIPALKETRFLGMLTIAVEPGVSALLPLSQSPKRRPPLPVKGALQHFFGVHQIAAVQRQKDDRMSDVMV